MPTDRLGQCVQRIVLASALAESVGEAEEVLFIDRTQYRTHGLLRDLVLDRGNAQRSLPAIRFGYEDPPGWQRPMGSSVNLPMQLGNPRWKKTLVFFPRHSIHTCRGLPLQSVEARGQQLRRDVMEQCCKSQPLVTASCYAYTFQTP